MAQPAVRRCLPRSMPRCKSTQSWGRPWAMAPHLFFAAALPVYLARFCTILRRGLNNSSWSLSTPALSRCGRAGHVGSWQTLGELQAREVWTDRVTQIFDVNYTADANDPANAGHNSGSQDAFVLTAYTLSRAATLQTRAEWFADPHGARAATPGTYGEATAGMTLHLKPWLEFRPEVRGDFSGQKSFGAEDTSIRHRNQISTGFELLFKGRLL